MTTMDVKGVSWVGHMCQRFEALCVDVDEAIYEDTFICVGNQMRNVGQSVKKFYSEVMQDLLSSSSLDSAKGKDALNTVEYNGDATAFEKQKFDGESESVDAASETTGNLSDGAATVKRSVRHDPCSSVEQPSTPGTFHSLSADSVSNNSTTAKSDLNRGQEQEDRLKSSFDVSSGDSAEEFTWNDSWNERDDVFCGCGDTASTKASAANTREEGTQTKGTCAELDNSGTSIEAALDTTITDNVQDAVEVDTMFSASDTETSRCWLAHETRTTVVDKQEGLKLEESCVLVENDRHISTLENAQKSYKKKFKAVFSPRKWAKARRDQDQLAGKHDEEVGQSSASTCTRLTEIQNSSTSESFDSEWELL